MSEHEIQEMTINLNQGFNRLAAVLSSMFVNIPEIRDGMVMDLSQVQRVITEALEVLESREYQAQYGLNLETQAIAVVAVCEWLSAADTLARYAEHAQWEWRVTRFFVHEAAFLDALEMVQMHLTTGIAWSKRN